MENAPTLENVFMLGDIRCEILPRSDTGTDFIPEEHYAIVADSVIDGKDYRWCDTFKNSIPYHIAKETFSKLVVDIFARTKKRFGRTDLGGRNNG